VNPVEPPLRNTDAREFLAWILMFDFKDGAISINATSECGAIEVARRIEHYVEVGSAPVAAVKAV
jgi:hypothetical protein